MTFHETFFCQQMLISKILEISNIRNIKDGPDYTVHANERLFTDSIAIISYGNLCIHSYLFPKHDCSSPNALRQPLHDFLNQTINDIFQNLPCTSAGAVMQSSQLRHTVPPRFSLKSCTASMSREAHWVKRFIKKMTFLNNVVFFFTNKIFSYSHQTQVSVLD